MTVQNKIFFRYFILGILLLLFIGCGPRIPQNRPPHFSEADLIGNWQAEYIDITIQNPKDITIEIIDSKPYEILSNGIQQEIDCIIRLETDIWNQGSFCKALYEPSTTLTGLEQYLFKSDGTFEQIFTERGSTPLRQTGTWELIAIGADAPKIKLTNALYFVNGIKMALGDYTVRLYPEMVDNLYDQEVSNSQRSINPVVEYPDDGFTYLYIRQEGDQIELRQMIHGGQDPDSRDPYRPIFIKK